MSVALLALFVALGGTGYAALKLPKNSVGAKQLKSNAVRSAKVKNGSLRAGDFKTGQLPQGPEGPRGPEGPKGDQGTAGTALAYGLIFDDAGTAKVSAGSAKGLTNANIMHPATSGTGEYCIGNLGFEPNNVQVTFGFFGGKSVATQVPATVDCPPPYDQIQINVVGDNGQLSNTPTFYLLIN